MGGRLVDVDGYVAIGVVRVVARWGRRRAADGRSLVRWRGGERMVMSFVMVIGCVKGVIERIGPRFAIGRVSGTSVIGVHWLAVLREHLNILFVRSRGSLVYFGNVCRLVEVGRVGRLAVASRRRRNDL